MAQSNGNGWIKWLAGGIVAGFLLSVGVSYALIQNQPHPVDKDDLNRISDRLNSIDQRLSRMEGALGIEEKKQWEN